MLKVSLDDHTPQGLVLKYSEPSKMMKEEIIEKTVTATNAGRRVGAGGRGMTFAYDLLNKKDRKKYMKGSDVVSYNLNELVPLNAFKMLDKKQQKELIEYWLNNDVISKNKLLKYWGVTQYTYEKVTKGLDITITSEKYLQYTKNRQTPEQMAEAQRKRAETLKAKKENKPQVKEIEAAKAESAAVVVESVPFDPSTSVFEQAIPSPQPVIELTIKQPEPPAPVFPPAAVVFNVTNRTGAYCLDTINRMLDFMNGDNRTIYRITLSVEEIRP